MSKKELERLPIIHKVINKQLTQLEGAKILDLSERHVRRLVKRIKTGGDIAIVHKNRGIPSKRKISEKLVNKILEKYQSKYPDFGPTFANEKLLENHNIKISRESLRKILIQSKLWDAKKNKSENLHQWRERKEHSGEMIQIDGSHHLWLEDRLDQEFCLLGYIDDASNEVFAKFYEYEGTFPILDSFSDFVKQKGFPCSAYIDRHSTYKTNRQASIEEELHDIQPDTQFERVMKNIGVKVIHARSPQAKGRVEKLFKTLQDRLIKEMRLADIKTIKDANKFIISYLPKFNKKFSKVPKRKHSLFKPVPKDFDYKWQFSIQDSRVVANDFTIRWCNRLFLVSNPYLSLKRQRVIIKQALNGDLRFETKNKVLTVKEITQKDLSLAKQDYKKIIKILNAPSHRKSKKSWMDRFYIGKPKVALVK
ncbi:ISNCY family transposase [Patescibacteria group bacterium]|nr:ISNCY family transposase [Patescibacteria group bacterium]